MNKKEKYVLNKYEITKNGKVFSTLNSNNNFERKELSLREDIDGYLDVGLVYNDKGDRMPFRVHRLVALKYISEKENHNVVNHKDLNKKNNNVTNLEWSTVTKNTQHAYDNNAYKSIKQVISIDKEGKESLFPSVSNAARHYGYSNPTTIQAILEGRRNNPISKGTRKGLYFKYLNTKNNE